jgi:DNA-binding LytR/AlgR family response regulator
LLASCKNAFEALEVLQHKNVDLLFSDIKMPKLNGLDLVKSLPHPPAIIFVTGYPEFAADSYEVNSTDYLLKPVSYERFLKAVNKAIVQIETQKILSATAAKEPNNDYTIFVRTGDTYKSVPIDDIKYIEAAGDFVKMFTQTDDDFVLVHSTMMNMEKKLAAGKFFRIHNSFIVAFRHIKDIIGNEVKISDGKFLPIARERKVELYKALNIKEKE